LDSESEVMLARSGSNLVKGGMLIADVGSSRWSTTSCSGISLRLLMDLPEELLGKPRTAGIYLDVLDIHC
jgi:hypothetical protein